MLRLWLKQKKRRIFEQIKVYFVARIKFLKTHRTKKEKKKNIKEENEEQGA